MSKNINLFGIALAAIVVGAVALPASAQWATCPGDYDDDDCYVSALSSNACQVVSGKIECYGSSGADTIYLVVQNNNLWAYGVIDELGTPEEFCCSSTELGSTIYAADIDTGAGDDVVCLRDSDLTVNSVVICEDISEANNEAYPEAANIDSGAGDDRISTGPVGAHDDTVYGGAGSDYILTWGGDDYIYGEGDGDYLYGGDHADHIDGGDDADYIYGNDGADIIDGGDGGDVIYGDAGNDVINGGCMSCYNDGVDTIYGGEGADWVKGWDGADVIYGGSGNDNLCGDDDADDIYGQDDDDCMCGGGDQVVGANADGADDKMDGGPDSDEAWYWLTGETDTVNNANANLSATCECYCEPPA